MLDELPYFFGNASNGSRLRDPPHGTHLDIPFAVLNSVLDRGFSRLANALTLSLVCACFDSESLVKIHAQTRRTHALLTHRVAFAYGHRTIF